MQLPDWVSEPITTSAKALIGMAILGVVGWLVKWVRDQFGKLDTIAAKQSRIDLTITGFDEKLTKLDQVASNQERSDKALETFDKTLGNLSESVKKIVYEVTPNGNGSMKDALARIEGRQQVAEGVLRSRIESADDIAVYCDPQGEITSVTAGYTEMTGLDAISSQRERWKLCIHSDDIASTLLAWHESLRTGNTFVAEIRYTHVVKGGARPCKVITSPVIVNNKIVQWASRIIPLGDAVYPADPDVEAALTHIDPASRKKQK